MPDTGWVSPGSVADTSSNASARLVDSVNMFDGNTATEGFFNADSDKGGWGGIPIAEFTNFGFDSLIPNGASIDGVEVRTQVSDVGGGTFIGHPRITIIPTALGSLQSTINSVAPYTAQQQYNLPSSNNIHIIGGSSSLWNATISYSDVTSITFGLEVVGWLFDGYVSLSHIEMRIHHTGGASDPMSVRDGGVWKAASPFVKDGGVWKPAAPSTRDGGVWKAT